MTNRGAGGPGRHLGYVLKRFPRVSETFIAAELIELERQGERVAVFAISRPDEPCRHGFLRELRAPVVYLPYRPLRHPVLIARSLLRVVRSRPRPWASAALACLWPPRLKAVRRLLQATVLADEMEKAGIDHAHAHFATAAARLANLVWRMGGPSYSVTAHAKDIYHEDVRTEHLRDKLGHASFVATVTRANRNHLRAVLGGAGRLHVVPNAVDLRRLATAERSEAGRGVLSVARLVEKKGLGDLIEACGLLRPPVHLDIVGDGPLRDQLEAAVTRCGADVTFHGALPHEHVTRLYGEAGVFCLPCVIASTGDRDGLPTSVLEAMALGVPVVTTAVNGLAEVVLHGKTGLVVPAHDPAALADALDTVLAEPELAARLSIGGRRHVERHFSLDRSVALLRSLFPKAA